jgi:hypothetical protein
MRKLLLGIAAVTILAISCEKDKDFLRATVIDTGDITTEGCGYVLRMADGKEELPVYLPSDFQHGNMKVKVKIHSSGILDTCRFETPLKFYERVYIDDIKKDLD